MVEIGGHEIMYITPNRAIPSQVGQNSICLSWLRTGGGWLKGQPHNTLAFNSLYDYNVNEKNLNVKKLIKNPSLEPRLTLPRNFSLIGGFESND